MRTRLLRTVALAAFGVGPLGCDASGGRGSNPAVAVNDSGARITVIRDTVQRCAACTIELRHVATLGSASDSVLLERTPILARDSRGRTFATVVDAGFQPIIVYSPDGRVERTIGREGKGPGEYTRVEALAMMPGDSVVLAHSTVGLTVYSPDGQYVRGGQLFARPDHIVPIADGRFVVNATVRTEQSVGLPFHYVDEGGALVRSFGTENIFPQEGPPFRAMAPFLSAGLLWISEQRQYRLELVDSVGTVSRVIAVETPWWPTFVSPEAVQAFEDSTRPPDRFVYDPTSRPNRLPYRPTFKIASILPDSSGRLWVAYHVHVSDWETLDVGYDGSTSERRLADDMKGRMYQTVVDAVDPESGMLLARRVIPGYGWMANDGAFVHIRYGEDGVISIDVSSVRLRGR